MKRWPRRRPAFILLLVSATTAAALGWWSLRPAVDPNDPAVQLLRSMEQWLQAPDSDKFDELRLEWPAHRTHTLLNHRTRDVRLSAVLTLAYVGDQTSLDPLIDRLRDPSSAIRRHADIGIWKIWSRLGSDNANRLVAQASRFIHDRDSEQAMASLEAAIEDSPDFEEAYNQRAILYFLRGDYADSVEDCHRALERMPMHYGALAGLGRCLIHLGRDAESLEAFNMARHINPNLHLDHLIKMLEYWMSGQSRPI